MYYVLACVFHTILASFLFLGLGMGTRDRGWYDRDDASQTAQVGGLAAPPAVQLVYSLGLPPAHGCQGVRQKPSVSPQRVLQHLQPLYVASKHTEGEGLIA